ncbi:MAG: beta-lactamase family protein [Proteobacteria bacterium]|nr:beta-lactamase family protein [Pseudomonadota bacterium]
MTCVLLASVARAEPGCAALDGIFRAAGADPVPGFAVAVVADGVLRCTAGYGAANLEFGQPVTAHTRFNIASLSKQFTAYALARAATARRVDLDRAIEPPIAGDAAAAAHVTVRQLLTHTSGLRDVETLFPMSGARPGDVITQTDALAMIHRQRALNFAPGTRFLYSNSGYVLAAEVARVASGLPLDALLAREVFQPAGMQHTSVLSDSAVVVEQLASSYALDRATGQWRHQPYNSTLLGSTNIASTAADLGAWAEYLLRLHREGDATVREMTTAAQRNDGETIDYGLGLELRMHRGLKAWSHTGAQAGFRSALMVFPDIGAAVVVLGNGGARTLPLAEKAADLFFGEQFPVAARAPDESATAALQSSAIARFAGIYELEPGLVLEILVDGERIAASMDPLGTVVLAPLASGRLLHAASGVEFSFDEQSDGRYRRVQVTGLGPRLSGRRQTPVQVTAERLQALGGRYYSSDLQARYELGTLDGHLSVQIPHLPPLRLTAIEGGRFVAPAIGLVLQIPATAGKHGTSFLAHTWRAQGIEFRRASKADPQ